MLRVYQNQAIIVIQIKSDFILLRKIAAISFLLMLLFNAFGYYLLFGYQQIQAHRIAIEEMPASSFKVIKMLVSAYADIEDRDFEYVDGSFFYEGQAYNFVKKRIKNDSLELYCLNNFQQDQLITQLNDYLNQNVIDGKASDNLPTKQMLKTFLKDYISLPIYTLVFHSKVIKKAVLCPFFKHILPVIYLSPPYSPPDFV